MRVGKQVKIFVSSSRQIERGGWVKDSSMAGLYVGQKQTFEGQIAESCDYQDGGSLLVIDGEARKEKLYVSLSPAVYRAWKQV